MSFDGPLGVLIAILSAAVTAVLLRRWGSGASMAWYHWLVLAVAGCVTAVYLAVALVLLYVLLVFKVLPWLAGLS